MDDRGHHCPQPWDNPAWGLGMDTLDMRRAGDRRETLAEARADASAVLGPVGYTAWQEGEYEHDLSADAGQQRDFEQALAAEAPERAFYLLQAELRSARVECREARVARVAEEAAIEVLELVRCPACCVALLRGPACPLARRWCCASGS